jgi:hypothetical protein
MAIKHNLNNSKKLSNRYVQGTLLLHPLILCFRSQLRGNHYWLQVPYLQRTTVLREVYTLQTVPFDFVQVSYFTRHTKYEMRSRGCEVVVGWSEAGESVHNQRATVSRYWEHNCVWRHQTHTFAVSLPNKRKCYLLCWLLVFNVFVVCILLLEQWFFV